MIIPVHAVELVIFRFGFGRRAVDIAVHYRTLGEADLVVDLLYFGLGLEAAPSYDLALRVVAPLFKLEVRSARLHVVDHVAVTSLLQRYAIGMLRDRFRDFQGLALALFLGQSVAGDEFLAGFQDAALRTREIVHVLAVEVAAETTDRIAVIVGCL